jgi:hypothetical protein
LASCRDRRRRLIDERADLDAGAIGKQKTRADGSKQGTARGFAAKLTLLGDGKGLEGFNGPLCSAVASHAAKHGAGLDRASLKEKLREAIEAAPKGDDRKASDIERYLSDAYLDGLIESAIEKFGQGIKIGDFVAYMPMHNYNFLPTREPWPGSSVDARLPSIPLFKTDGTPLLDADGKQEKMTPSFWLDKHQPVEQMTWAPGFPTMIKDKLVADGGWIDRSGMTCLNLYRPPTIKMGNAAGAKRWVDLVKQVYPDDYKHIIAFCAQRVQHPEIKINHGLVLGGVPGIGKDTILEAVKHAVGPWNFSEVSPMKLFGAFNPHLKSVILRISEAHDLGDVNRYTYYERTKTLKAAPPDVLECNEKNLREHKVFNVCGVIETTNHLTDGLYLPPDDRRHYVAWSDLTEKSFSKVFWDEFWHWYSTGGLEDIAAYLNELDLTDFNPKAPPLKTKAFWTIVDANRAPEEGELADAIDKLGEAASSGKIKRPEAVTLDALIRISSDDFGTWLNDRKNRRAIPHRLATVGYIAVRNSDAKDSLWKIGERRQVVYVKSELSLANQIKAARELVKEVNNEEKAC